MAEGPAHTNNTPRDPASGRRFILQGPGGPIDLSQSVDAPSEHLGRAPRYMRARAVIVTDGPLTDPQREALMRAGAIRIDPLGPGSYTVAMPESARAGVAALPFVRTAAWFRPEWKLDPGLGRNNFVVPERIALQARGMVRIQVHMFAGADAPEVVAVRDTIAGLPGAVVYGTSVIGRNTMISADIARIDLDSVASLPSVQFMEQAPEITFRNATARGVVQSNTPGITPIHSAGITGQGEIIAVCDSGLDANHCAFTDVPGKIVAYNGAVNATDHGTHVACIAAGDANAAGDLRGHAYDARLVFSRTPAFTFDQLLDTLETQASQGAFVHTNSWGDDFTTSYSGMCRAIDDFMHANEDDLVVFAATNQAFLKTPENAKNCLSVAAVNDAPNQDFQCSGGGGLTFDGRLKPDVLAPGCGINSADGLTVCGVKNLSGTSMAAPAVAGCAVLVREYFDCGFYPSGVATPSDAFVPSGALLKAAMINSATGAMGIPDLPTGATLFRAWGRILLDDVLYLPGDTRRTMVRDVRNDAGLTQGSTVDIPVTVTGSSLQLKVTLAWTDAPSAPGIQFALVNNLDLQVISPGNADTYLGNVFTGGASVTGGSADTKNNVEQVHIDAPTPGVWTVRISGTSIPTGPQGFALFVTGEVDPSARPVSVTAIDPPTEILPGVPTVPFTVRIDEGSDSVVPGSPTLHYKYAGPSFSQKPLVSLGNDLYQATLPWASCGHAPKYFVTAEGVASGVVAGPVGGSAGPQKASVGSTTSSVVFAEDFEAGIPLDWTSTNTPNYWDVDVAGPWVATSSCSGAGGCTGNVWAYCGNPGTCTYGVQFLATTGSLFTPTIVLPALAPGESLTLTYCAAMSNENTSRYDRGMVRIGGNEIDTTPHTGGAWQVREVDLSGFAGQSIQLEFFFDTVDASANNFVGWLIDSLVIEHTTHQCIDPCPGDLNGSGSVNVADFNILASHFSLEPNATREEGDLNGDGKVNVADFNILAGAFASFCGL